MTMQHDDPFQLQRFTTAQAVVYDDVLVELRSGRKRSHWMWFIFPQIAGLGHSDMAQRYAISGLNEARAYLAHPMLGARLRECAALVAAVEGRTIGEIFGSPDDLKFHASMTLFAEAATVPAEEVVFDVCLRKYFGGRLHEGTLACLRGGA
jgi:uncharacterized protein (DUF1810 family)